MKQKQKRTVILLSFELDVRPIQNLPVKIKFVWLEWMATREECKNALTWQSTIKWENVWSFITNTHSLPPMLPCFARGDMKGGTWRRGQGGLRRPEHSFNSPIFSSLLTFRLLYKRTRSTSGQHCWPLLLFTPISATSLHYSGSEAFVPGTMWMKENVMDLTWWETPRKMGPVLI